MRELSLFTGAGGGVLASKLLGFRTVGYVEFNKYCQKIIAQRIKDGIFDEAPIFGDIRVFADLYAGIYRDVCDVISAGFPCQPFSVAGKGLAENDPRNMWPETLKCVRAIRPTIVFLENVPGLLAHGYIRRIFGDLASVGYDCRWDVMGAADVGANHRRKRLWILAKRRDIFSHAEYQRLRWGQQQPEGSEKEIDVSDSGFIVPGSAQFGGNEEGAYNKFAGRSEILSDSQKTGFSSLKDRQESWKFRRSSPRFGKCFSEWWKFEPPVGRVVNGLANRNDRLKAIGNGQVPAVAAEIFTRLMEDFNERA